MEKSHSKREHGHRAKLKQKSQSQKIGNKLNYVDFVILTRKENDDPHALKFVDVAYIQSLPENRNAVFQVASNFNGVEAQSEIIRPDSVAFTEKYYADRTQGPAASISAGAGAITRVHAAFYDPKTDPQLWGQRAENQINFLSKLKDHYPMKNGYVVYTGEEPKFPKRNSPEYQKLLHSTKVLYHKDLQVITGHRNGAELEKVNDPDQTVDQVMCAAVNIFQGRTGSENSRAPYSELKCRLVLDMAYQGTYLTCINNRRTQIFLTLVGGGIFGNKKDWIYDAIVNAHLKFGVKGKSSLEKVTLIVFNPRDISANFMRRMEEEGIPVKYVPQEGEGHEKDE